jgi:hypothetical protein
VIDSPAVDKRQRLEEYKAVIRAHTAKKDI